MPLRIAGRSLQIVATLSLCLPGSAQTPTNKVGVINFQGAIAGTKEGRKASQQLDTKFQPKQKEFNQRQSELAQLQDEFNKGGSILNEDKRNQLVREIDQKKKALERDTADAKDDLVAEQQRLLEGLGQRLMAVVDKYAKEKGYSLILEVGNPNTPVMYASGSTDITQEIVAQYDRSSPVTANPTSSQVAPSADKRPATIRTAPPPAH